MIAIAAIAAACIGWSGVAGAGTSPDDGSTKTKARTITVSATGQVEGTPDVLELVVGVQTRDKTAKTALDRNNNLAKRVIAAVKDAGVEDKDVQTSEFSISPTYDDDNDISGYQVSNIVSAKIRDFNKAGEVIDAATKIAGDEVVIYGVQFSFDDNSLLVAKARNEAVTRAKNQAEQLAKAADVDLGDLMSISEDSTPEPPVLEARAAAGDVASAPIEPGSETLSVQVTLVYEIK